MFLRTSDRYGSVKSSLDILGNLGIRNAGGQFSPPAYWNYIIKLKLCSNTKNAYCVLASKLSGGRDGGTMKLNSFPNFQLKNPLIFSIDCFSSCSAGLPPFSLE